MTTNDARTQLDEERRIIDAATAGPMWMSNPHGPSEIFQGEGSGSDLMCAEFYRASDAKFYLHARTALPTRSAQVEAVLIELAVYEVPRKAADPTGAVAAGMERLEARIRRAIEEAGA